MPYVIRRTDQGGGYVTRPGVAASYTHSIALARAFVTREAAERECCPGNEVVVDRDSLLTTTEG
jgi:hypothetical protein